MDRADYVLPDVPECPGCGLEAEVEEYYRRISDKVRVGYLCSCGTVVINGVVQGFGRR